MCLFLLAYAPRRPLETTTRSLSETRTEQSSLRGSHFGVYEYHFNCDFRATRRNSIYGFIHKICQNLTAASSCQALSVACHVTRRSIGMKFLRLFALALLWYFHCTIFDDRCSFVALAIPSWRFMPATLPNALALPDPCVHTPFPALVLTVCSRWVCGAAPLRGVPRSPRPGAPRRPALCPGWMLVAGAQDHDRRSPDN